MNKIFKIKRNTLGQSVVTSELAKNKGKTASVVAVLLSGLFSVGAVNATPVSIQGSATSENAVAVGSNSYATAIDGVATGQGAVATGQGFTREEFVQKVAESQVAIDAVNAKQDEVNNKSNQLDSTNDAIDSLGKQINDLAKQQKDIANKISKRDDLLDKQSDLKSKVDNSQSAVNNAKTDLDGVSTSGKNLYLNFTDVLNSLKWDILTSSNNVEQNRNALAQELQSKVEQNYSDFADKYTAQDYRNIVDGYLNRQASYQGSFEYFSEATTDRIRYLNDNLFFNKLYFNTQLNSEDYSITDKYKYFEHHSSLNQYEYGSNQNGFFGTYIDKNGVASNLAGRLSNSVSSERGSFYTTLLSMNDESVLNAINLISLSKQKSLKDGVYTALMDEISGRVDLSSELNLYIGERNFKDFYNQLIYSATDLSQIRFGLKLDDSLTNQDKRFISGLGIFKDLGVTGEQAPPLFYDLNLGVISKIRDLTVSNQNLISSSDIDFFKNFYSQLEKYYSAIDWNFDKSAINLTAYKSSLDKILAYNAKIDTILDLYQSIINERKKSDSDIAQIDAWTQQMMSLKSEVLDGVSDKTNFGMGIELVYNKEWADYYLYYAKDEADAMIKRINSELKLYDDTDELIVEVTSRAKEIQKAYDDAVAQLAKDQAELDKINKQIDELKLTESEKAVDDTKRDKEQELAERKADKSRLEDEIAKGNEELEKLREELSKTELKDLGLRSQAHGSEAFASGNDSIAMGTRATITANDGIAIGRDASVTGEQSIAIGAESVVTGDKSIAIGVGHTVSGNRSTTIGDPNVVTGDNSFVAGNNNKIHGSESLVVGNYVNIYDESSKNNVLLGNNVNLLSGEENVIIAAFNGDVVGSSNTIVGSHIGGATNGSTLMGHLVVSNSNNVTAIGNHITVNDGFDNSVVLGASSEAATANPTSSIEIQGNTYNFAGTNPTSTVSVGAVGQERQIVNVAAGRISETSTDAINGSQLYALVSALGDNQHNQDQLDEIQNQIDSAGWKVTIDESTGKATGAVVTDVKNGNTVTFVAGDNIALEQSDTTITINAVATVDLDTKTIINTEDGLTSDMEVIDGNIVYDIGLDDATKAQLNKDTTVSSADGISLSVSSVTNANGGTTTNYKVSLSDATKAQLAKETVVSGENGISVRTETNTNENGGTTTNYIVSLATDLVNQIAKEENVIAGSDAVTVVQNGRNETGGNTFVVDLSDQTKAQLAKETKVEAGSNVIVTPTQNETGGNTYTVELAKDVDLGNDGSFKAGDVSIKGGIVTGLDTPVDEKDAVNKDYVDNSHTTVSSDGTINVIDSVTNVTTGAKDYNVSINKAGAEQLLTVKYAGDTGSGENPLSDTITFAGDTYITTHAENGKVTTGLTEQAKDMLESTQKGLNFADTNGTTVNRQLGDTLNIVGDVNGNINTEFDEHGNLVVSLSETIKAGDITINDNGKITGVTNGEVSATSKDVVNGSQLHETNINVANNAANIAKGLNSETDDGKVVNYQLGDTIKVTGDNKNLSTTTTADGKVSVRMADDIKVNSVTAGNVSLSTTGINAGGNKVTNVAPGEVSPTSMDAVNGSQLYALGDTLMQNIENVDARAQQGIRQLDAKVNKLEKKRKAGMASALATAGLPQPHREGQSGFVAGVGQYQGETGVAVGYSRISDNGKWIIRASASTNTRKEVGGQIGVGYFW